ncbi:MAG: hypothetical protein Q8P03_01240, partial [bacterium]|nr:hypothetical protein [bacterium]
KMNEEQETTIEQQGGGVSPLDPDFLLFAVPFALLIDGIDFVFQLGIILNLFLGAPLIWWMTKRGGQAPGAGDLQARQAQRQAARTAARRALRRGLIVFALELIPVVSLFPFWLIAVFAMLRQQSSPQPTQQLQEAV